MRVDVRSRALAEPSHFRPISKEPACKALISIAMERDLPSNAIDQTTCEALANTLDRSCVVTADLFHGGVASFGERVAAVESLCDQESLVGQARKRRVKGFQIRAAETEHFSRCHQVLSKGTQDVDFCRSQS